MKFVFVLLLAATFHFSAQAQEPEVPGKPTDEMTLLGTAPAKPIHVEDKTGKKQPSAKKRTNKVNSKKTNDK